MICGKSYSFRIRFPNEYAFMKTFESVFDEDKFFNSCLLYGASHKGGVRTRTKVFVIVAGKFVAGDKFSWKIPFCTFNYRCTAISALVTARV